MSDPQYTHLPWVRQGTSRLIATVDDLSANPKARAALDVELVLDVEGASSAPSVPHVGVRVYGPGDVTGIDPRLVVRMEPPPGTTGFEVENFPFVEFARADLPWMFSPLKANKKDQLRPWLALVAVEQRPGVTLNFDPSSHTLPVLQVDDASKELPDPRDCFAWAHAEYVGGDAIDQVLRSHPEVVISRLLCARRLKARRSYYACVVPVFEVGRLAGLGQPLDHVDDLRYAWSSSSRDVKLPVYHSWSFSTGAAGSFEALATQLKPAATLDGVGTRDMDVSQAGGGLTLPGAAKPGSPFLVGLEGALRPLNWTAQWPTGHPAAEEVGAAIEGLLNRAQALSATDAKPVLSPPVYGGGPAGQRTCGPGAPAWLRTLNRDPRYRVAAGIGSAVVHALRDQLLNAAWKQIGEVRAANRALAQAQLARANSRSIWDRRLPGLDAGSLIQVTGPIHSRVTLPAGRTVADAVGKSRLPDAFPSVAFRRTLSPVGVLRRRAQPVAVGVRPAATLFQSFNDGTLTASPPPAFPSGGVNVDTVLQQFHPTLSVSSLAAAVRAAPSKAGFPISDDPGVPATKAETPGASTKLFRQALTNSLKGPLGTIVAPPPAPKPLNVAEVTGALTTGLEPGKAVHERVGSLLAITGTWSQPDPLEPILAAPSIVTPMSEPLKTLSQDFLLPGLGKVPPNTVALAEPNWAFIEAYMIGLNYEMGRELLWSEYPTDKRGTYFRQFFDPRGHVPPPTTDQERAALEDITPIHLWGRDRPLGDPKAHAGGTKPFVLLIRADLLRRFPNALIYATPALRQADGSLRPSQAAADERYPAFQGRLEPDVTFAGFDLPPDLRGDPRSGKAGWFFVIQQHMTEPHYGLATSVHEAEDGELAWDAVAMDQTSAYAPVIDSLPDKNATRYGVPRKQWAWGKDSTSADLAAITLRHPVRIAIHASELLPDGAP